MPQIYKKRTSREVVSHDIMLKAIESVKSNEKSIRQAANYYNIPRNTLNRYIKKHSTDVNVTLEPNFRQRQIFTKQQEAELAIYLKDCSKRFYGLTTVEARQFAYDLAKANNIKMPDQWSANETAGRAWLQGFMKRNPQISIRVPEATSIARATAFNRPNVAHFFDELESALKATGVTGDRIFNLDETGFNTVTRLPKVISPRGEKQVGQIVSTERGVLVTCVAIISATGVALPPVIIMPRKKNQPGFQSGCRIENTLILTNPITGSAWMCRELFAKTIDHIVIHTQSSKERPIILVMDNHESHVSYEGLNKAKECGIHIVTLPAHTSNKTQPLDKTVFGPMKSCYGNFSNSWMLQNPGQPITIHQMPELITKSYLRACTPENILSGFQRAGIWPLDRDIFPDEWYLPATVSERPMAITEPITDEPEPIASTSNQSADETCLSTSVDPSTVAFSKQPSECRPFPRSARANTDSSRPRRRKAVTGYLTATPEMERRKPEPKKAKKTTIPRRLAESSESSDSDEPVPLESDSSEPLSDENEPITEDASVEHKVAVGDYCLVEFATKKTKILYVGKVLDISTDKTTLSVDFYRRSGNLWRSPPQPDIADVDCQQIAMILPRPMQTGGTARLENTLNFGIELAPNVR